MIRKKPSIFYGYIIVALAFIILAISLGTANSFGVFLEPMLNEYGWSRSSVSGAFSLSQLAGGVIGVVAGRLTDKVGPRLILSISAIFLGAGYSLMALVHSHWQMYLFYGVLTGIGTTGPIIPLYSISTRWFTRRRALAAGIISCGMGVGTIIISQIANWLISISDWRFAFITIGLVNLIIVGLAAQFMKRDPQSIGQLPDGVSDLVKEDTRLPVNGLTLTEAIHTRQFWLLLGTIGLVLFTTITIMAHIVIHATDLMISRNSAVGLLSIISISGLISRVLIGGVADKIGNRQTIIVGIALFSIAFIWLIFSKELWMLILFAVVFGFAWGTYFVPLTPLTAELFGLKSIGSIMGMSNIGGAIGMTVGPFLAGYLYDIQKSYQFAFILLFIASIVALVLMLFLRTNRPVNETNQKAV